VYRAVEKTAHGMLSWQRQDVITCGIGAVMIGIWFNILVVVLAFPALLTVVLIGRQAWEGRRDYLLLLIRRFERKRHYRALDRDSAYRVYPRGST
jgi:hypothetical protein